MTRATMQKLRESQHYILMCMRSGPRTADEIATNTGRSVRDVRASLQKLQARGLVGPGPLAPRRAGVTDGQIPQTWKLTAPSR